MAVTLTPPPLGSDGQCTGLPETLGNLDFHHCCLIHDAGGTDGMFYDCMVTELSRDVNGYLAGFMVALIIVGLTAGKPIYNLLQHWGWVK